MHSNNLLPIPYASYQHQQEDAWNSESPFTQVEMQIDTALKANEHRIEISADAARLYAGNTLSLAEASNSFSQLVGLNGYGSNSALPLKLPACTIVDSPEFAWRSLQLDATTNIFSLEQLKQLVKAMALYKLNILQLVLGTNAAWRMELKGYPKLDTAYTQAELKELANYALARGVSIVPVVDMPAGVRPVVAAYPILGVINPEPGSSVLGAHTSAYQFVKDVLLQLTEVFPSPYIQVGDFRSSLADWATIPAVNQERARLDMKREFELVGHFMQLCQESLTTRKRKLIVPDSTELMRLPEDTVVLVQNNLNTVLELTSRGYQVIFTQSNSLNLAKPGTFLTGGKSAKGIYRDLASLMQQDEFRPNAVKRTLILGFMAHFSAANVTQSQLHNLLFPRLIAFAQQVWNGPKRQSAWGTFKRRLPAQYELLAELGIKLQN